MARFTLENGLEVEVYSKNLGFGPGENIATVYLLYLK